eukprot:TRINITY_DN72854_c0_g1_i1.p1 TRINITY_DN72854_c0_g1~~TRINITY_DN72854_c0_g1_i1.p1  ORF type:complete len:285 (+),score=68.51 TRINITY_DN72854_c0_g1_i1:65-856(+)
MGNACCFVTPPAREDEPKGNTEMIITAKSMVSNDFLATDSAGAPWIDLLHNGDFGFGPGSIKLKMASGAEGVPLFSVNMERSEFNELANQDFFDWGWFDGGPDQHTVLHWSMRRHIIFSDKNEKEVAALTCDYAGLARATKDVEYDQEEYGVEREVNWNKEARCGKLDISLKVNGEDCQIQHQLSPDNWTYASQYKVSGGGSFDFEYVSNWGLDQILIKTGETAPLSALSIAFVLAYWMHPKRAEDVAKDRAMEILQQRYGYW